MRPVHVGRISAHIMRDAGCESSAYARKHLSTHTQSCWVSGESGQHLLLIFTQHNLTQLSVTDTHVCVSPQFHSTNTQSHAPSSSPKSSSASTCSSISTSASPSPALLGMMAQVLRCVCARETTVASVGRTGYRRTGQDLELESFSSFTESVPRSVPDHLLNGACARVPLTDSTFLL